MDTLGNHWHWVLTILIYILHVSEHFEVALTSVISEVKLSNIEIRYLTERLKKHEHMGDDDIRYTIVELEHFYTILKNKDGIYEPSVMVDKAWHHHILNTKMYNIFSRRHFGVEILHHTPFWSEYDQEIEEESFDPVEEFDCIETYDTLVSMFGSENVNQTVWFITENELNNVQILKVAHNEFEL